MMTHAELWEMDLRKTCIHEAGHLVVLRAFGCHGAIVVEPTEAEDLMAKRAFVGRCIRFTTPETEHEDRVVKMAGSAAEMLDADPDTEAFEFLDNFESEPKWLSETDAHLGVTIEAIEAAFAILRERWSEVVLHAESEIVVWKREGAQ